MVLSSVLGVQFSVGVSRTSDEVDLVVGLTTDDHGAGPPLCGDFVQSNLVLTEQNLSSGKDCPRICFCHDVDSLEVFHCMEVFYTKFDFMYRTECPSRTLARAWQSCLLILHCAPALA